ncbi:MAG: GNAT family N-acetyltransferase [Actinobacteria bacterium]|nr:MAG: GNAT family N-acetyltransferase [Actinomycetota bacterium]
MTVVVGIDDRRWCEFVEGHTDATLFHHPAWCRVLERAYGYRPFAVALERPDGRLTAGLPLMEVRGLRGRRWLSLPFTDACRPLSNGQDPALAEALDAERQRAGVRLVEIRGPITSPPGHPAARGLNHTLTLRSDPDDLLRTFSRSQVQRNISRAVREGVRVRRSQERADLLEVFYRLHLQTRRRHGVPIQPRTFFEQLWERLLAQDLGFVLVAEVDGRPAAAAVFLAWNGTLTYKFGASDPASWTRRPNHLLFWEAIRWGCEHRYATLDFGRTDFGNEGLRAFKQGWGTIETELVYATLGARAPALGDRRLTAALGAVIRRTPSWVCRLAGEALYRYAA